MAKKSVVWTKTESIKRIVNVFDFFVPKILYKDGGYLLGMLIAVEQASHTAKGH